MIPYFSHLKLSHRGYSVCFQYGGSCPWTSDAESLTFFVRPTHGAIDFSALAASPAELNGAQQKNTKRVLPLGRQDIVASFLALFCNRYKNLPEIYGAGVDPFATSLHQQFQ